MHMCVKDVHVFVCLCGWGGVGVIVVVCKARRVQKDNGCVCNVLPLMENSPCLHLLYSPRDKALK